MRSGSPAVHLSKLPVEIGGGSAISTFLPRRSSPIRPRHLPEVKRGDSVSEEPTSLCPVDLLSEALDRLAAGEGKPYLDEDSDRVAATHFYAKLEPDQGGALAGLLETSHNCRPSYSPADELYFLG
jgi:hypothetical protein